MSWELAEHAAEIPDLLPTWKLLLMAICHDADADGVSYPGRDKLAAWSGLGRSQCAAAIGGLIERGLLVRISQGRKGHRATFRVELDDGPYSVRSEPDAKAGAIGSGKGPVRVRQLPDPSPTTQPKHREEAQLTKWKDETTEYTSEEKATQLPDPWADS